MEPSNIDPDLSTFRACCDQVIRWNGTIRGTLASVVIAAAVGSVEYFKDPPNVETWMQTTLRVGTASALGVLAFLAIAFVMSLFIAPQRQRDTARRQRDELESAREESARAVARGSDAAAAMREVSVQIYGDLVMPGDEVFARTAKVLHAARAESEWRMSAWTHLDRYGESKLDISIPSSGSEGRSKRSNELSQLALILREHDIVEEADSLRRTIRLTSRGKTELRAAKQRFNLDD